MRTFSSSFFHRFPRKTIEPNLDERLFHLILIQKFNFLYFHQEKNNNSTKNHCSTMNQSHTVSSTVIESLHSGWQTSSKRPVWHGSKYKIVPSKKYPRLSREISSLEKKNAANSKHTRRTRAETRASHWFTLLRDTLNLCGEAAWLIDTRFLALCFERDSLLQGVVKQNQKNSTIKLIRSFKLFFCNLVWMRPEFKVVDF